MKPRRPWNLLSTMVVAVLIVGGGAALYATGVMKPPSVSAEELDRVLIVAAAPDEDGEVVGQILAVASVRLNHIEPLDPALEVAIPGTSFSTLGDAYPFGGGAGTASAYERASDEDLPYLALTPEQLTVAVEEAGGLKVTLPASLSVFDGEQLYTFDEGTHTLDAAEVRAVLKGAPYLSAREREELNAELAEAFASALGRSDMLGITELDTNLDDAALGHLKASLSRTGSAS